MRTFAFALLLLSAGAGAQPATPAVRDLYDASLHDKEKNRLLVMQLRHGSRGNTEKGYLGAALMLSARYGINPFRKHRDFSEGKVLLEEAIAKDHGNAELRFLRFCIQSNAPRFLGYRDDLAGDWLFLSRWLEGSTAHSELRRRIAESLNNPAID